MERFRRSKVLDLDYNTVPVVVKNVQGPLLLTWINFYLNMEK